MKKFIDILLFSLLFFFIFSYFGGKNSQVPLDGLSFKTTKSSYNVPAGVGLSITNNTTSLVNIDTCQDISLRYAGSRVDFPEGICEQIELASREQQKIDFSPYYSLFENPGNYTFELSLGEQKYIQQVEIEYRGSIGKLFTGLLFAPMYNLLAFLMQTFSHSLGWAIVAITIIIRIVLLFPQHKMMV